MFKCRTLENQLDKTLIKCGEAAHIKTAYEGIIDTMLKVLFVIYVEVWFNGIT